MTTRTKIRVKGDKTEEIEVGSMVIVFHGLLWVRFLGVHVTAMKMRKWRKKAAKKAGVFGEGHWWKQSTVELKKPLGLGHAGAAIARQRAVSGWQAPGHRAVALVRSAHPRREWEKIAQVRRISSSSIW